MVSTVLPLHETGLAVLRARALLVKIRKGTGHTVPLQITPTHFDYAFDHILPSVSIIDPKKYDTIRDQMARARSLVDVREKEDENR